MLRSWLPHWHGEGGICELLGIAFPLILSNAFMTLQITIDRIFLSQYSSDAVAASMPAMLVFWTPLALLQNTTLYATTFVAQYLGAGRPQRIGPAVWQALYFAVGTGVAFLSLLPLIGPLVALIGHPPAIQVLEATYFRCLCFGALPTLLIAAANSFFIGRGDSWTVLLVNATGFAVNATLDYALIFGHWGFPQLGMTGAGVATVAGSWAGALVALGLLFRPQFDAAFATVRGWKPEADLFRRLLRFGLPNGLQWALDALAFTFFINLVGWLGEVALAATSVAVTINIMAILPILGLGQAVEVLVGQRLGADAPELAEKTTWTGFQIGWAYMCTVALLFALFPEPFVYFFRSTDPKWTTVAAVVPVLLRFVAVYTVFDSMSLIFSFALRGAGDTRFVTAVSLLLAWPIMVLPTWLACIQGWGLYWCWAFASAYIIALGFTFLLRFLAGKWKAMRVIENVMAIPPQGTPSLCEASESLA